MPRQAPRTCTYAGCPAIVARGRCQQHEVQRTRLLGVETDARRLPSSQRGYDARWRIVRDAQLFDFPLCALCRKKGRATSATCVDHLVPVLVNPDLIYDLDNLQSLCKPCHDRKTAREDGGFRGRRQ